MKRLLAIALCLPFVSCSSSPDHGTSTKGDVLLFPVAEGAQALDGAMTVVSVSPNEDGSVVDVLLRASSKNVTAFARPRWFGDTTLKLEFRSNGDGWSEVQIAAGKDVLLRVVPPYPFAKTLGLEFAATRPAPVKDEGKALPGRLVVTPEQAAKLTLYRYPDLTLTQYESPGSPAAPKLAVWRDGKGKVIAALEIYVRTDAKAAGDGVSFLHTNGKKQIGTSLAYANTRKGAPDEDGWSFMVFQQAEGREVAVPWKPLVKNASYLGACGAGTEGLDATQFGDSVKVGSFAADGTADLEKARLQPPSWSQADPTGGSLSSGAPVKCEYDGAHAQRWSVETGTDMTFTPTGGAAGTGISGTLPSGSGSCQLGTLHADTPGMHKFVYANEVLHEDPTSSDRLTTADGPACPGDAPSATTDILSEAGHECSSAVPGCTTHQVGGFVELAVPCVAAAGTAILEIAQKDKDPGFIAVACDGDTRDRGVAFAATPIDETDAAMEWVDRDNGLCAGPEPQLYYDEGPPPVRPPPRDPKHHCQGHRMAIVIGPDSGAIKAALQWMLSLENCQHKLWVKTRIDTQPNFKDLRVPNAGGNNYEAFTVPKPPTGGKPSKGTDPGTVEDFMKKKADDCCHWDEVIIVAHGHQEHIWYALLKNLGRLLAGRPCPKLVLWICSSAEDFFPDSPREIVGKNDKGSLDTIKNCHLLEQISAIVRPKSCCGCINANCDCYNANDKHAGHCPDEHTPTKILCAAWYNTTTSEDDNAKFYPVTSPVGIDPNPDRQGRPHWQLTSPDGRVRTITIHPEADPGNGCDVTTEQPAGSNDVFDGTPLGTEEDLKLADPKNTDTIDAKKRRKPTHTQNPTDPPPSYTGPKACDHAEKEGCRPASK